MIRALKHLADLGMVQPLADLMMQNPPDRLADECFDFVLPVPLSRERLLQRGFNQSEGIVGLLAQRYGWRILPRHTVFRHHRPPQSTLKGSERRRNIKNAFEIRTPIPENCNILLIDDVFTTGATLDELAKTLKKIGRKPNLLLDAGTHANEKITKFFDTPSALWQGYAPISD